MSDRTPRLVKWYRLSFPYRSPRHEAVCAGEHGGVTFWCSWCESTAKWHGGLEVHYASPPGYMAGDDPSHTNCEVTGGRCWHDGTSLYASETLIPMWCGSVNNKTPGTPEEMLSIAEWQYRKRFMESDEE